MYKFKLLKMKMRQFFGVCVLIKRGKDLTREVFSNQIFGKPDRSKIIDWHRGICETILSSDPLSNFTRQGV